MPITDYARGSQVLKDVIAMREKINAIVRKQNMIETQLRRQFGNSAAR